MSRSRKLPIYKDGSTRKNSWHKCLRRKVKRRIRQAVKDIIRLRDYEEYEIPASKALINDYDWCDYILDYRQFNALPGLWQRGVTDIKEYMKEMQDKFSRK